jgi:hypothetical protein
VEFTLRNTEHHFYRHLSHTHIHTMGNRLSAKGNVSLSDLVVRPGVPPEQPMSADIIRQGLTTVAATLHSKGQNISIVAVGGAVNTLLLHTRESTGDVDFFYWTKTKNEDVTKVIVAANTAATKLKLGDQWLNNHTAIFIDVRLTIELELRILYSQIHQPTLGRHYPTSL